MKKLITCMYLTSWWKKGLIDKSEEKTRQSIKELLLCFLLCKKMYQLYQKRIGIWRFEVVFGKLDFETFFSWYFIPRAKFANFHNFFSSHIKPEIIKLCLSLVSSSAIMMVSWMVYHWYHYLSSIACESWDTQSFMRLCIKLIK